MRRRAAVDAPEPFPAIVVGVVRDESQEQVVRRRRPGASGKVARNRHHSAIREKG